MFRGVSRFSLCSTRRASAARYFRRMTADLINRDASGQLVVDKVPVIVGNPGEAYVLTDPKVGNALHAASPLMSAAGSVGDRCQLTYFHDSQHFGFGKISLRCSTVRANSLFLMPGSSPYPRLHVPIQIARRTESDTSPATLFLDGKMHELVLDGTPDGN